MSTRISCFVFLFLAIAPLPSLADTIAVIGTGNVAGALGPEFAAQGHTIVYGSREPSRDDVRELVARTGNGASVTTPEDAVGSANIVVLAVPGLLVKEIAESLGDLSGKIIIDPTNPLTPGDGRYEKTIITSNAEIIQAAAPEAFVVKAFNTLGWETMVEPGTSGGTVSIPLIGDNDDAKASVAALVEGMGLEPIDIGPLDQARYVEGMLILWINNRVEGREHFDFFLRKTTKE
jgi:predicted dinucleotide-binding enzyme